MHYNMYISFTYYSGVFIKSEKGGLTSYNKQANKNKINKYIN